RGKGALRLRRHESGIERFGGRLQHERAHEGVAQVRSREHADKRADAQKLAARPPRERVTRNCGVSAQNPVKLCAPGLTTRTPVRWISSTASPRSPRPSAL